MSEKGEDDEKKGNALERQDSVISILSGGFDFCRICHCDSSSGELISPCYCSGTLRFVHQVCLQHWVRSSNNKNCELCRYPFVMRSKLKPICQWEALPMTGAEKRRVVCSALFHAVAIGCVLWSLFVLIERTVEEFHHYELEWQFWTKIVVELIGSLGAAILIWVWGKSYIKLIRNWLVFNRTFVIVSSDPGDKKIGHLADRPPSSKTREGKTLLLPPLLYAPPEHAPTEPQL